LNGKDSTEVVAAILKHFFKDELNEKSYNEIGSASNRRNKDFNDYDDRGARGYSGSSNNGSYVDRKGTARLFVAKGRADGMDPSKLASFISQETGVPSSRIDDIKVLDTFSFIAVAFEDAENILKAFQQNSIGRSVVSRAKDKKPEGGGFEERRPPRAPNRDWGNKDGFSEKKKMVN